MMAAGLLAAAVLSLLHLFHHELALIRQGLQPQDVLRWPRIDRYIAMNCFMLLYKLYELLMLVSLIYQSRTYYG